MLTIENKHTAKVLGTYDVETEEDALQQLATEAGYNSFDDSYAKEWNCEY